MKLKLLFLSLLLSGCAVSTQKTPVEIKENGDGLEYSLINVEGMPCILIQNYSAHSASFIKSITCDWSKYDGE